MATEKETTDVLWPKIIAVALIVVVLGLPINHILSYALLVSATLIICVGTISVQWQRWLGAIAVVGATFVTQVFLAAPRIEEGHNVFVVDPSKPDSALERHLPPDVYGFMAAQFDALYPIERRCDPRKSAGCWLASNFPDRVFAFSSDSIFDRPAYSRRVTGIDFDDPIWLRLGFTNDLTYNWYNDRDGRITDVQRGHRDPRFWVFWHRWRLDMPWFVMYRFPAQFVGSHLCWRGDVLWERANGKFVRDTRSTMSCRLLTADDVGLRIFGVAIRPGSLAMKLEPTAKIRMLQLALPLVSLLSVSALLLLLVRCRLSDIKLCGFLLALGLVLIILSDISFLGGFRYHDGGGDGLAYEGWARWMIQFLMQGDIRQALRGGEDIFYFTPGMRYLRFIEHLIFGETNFGYLSLLLAMPIIVWTLFRRFLTIRWTLAAVLIFVLTPVGLLFGSNYFLYVQNASLGYADAAAAIIFLGSILLLFERTEDRHNFPCFMASLCAALLMAIAVQVRPNLAPAAAVLLGGVGVMALWNGQYRRLAGMCIGFLPASLSSIHNWYYGGALVPFSSNATHDSVYKVTPLDYLWSLQELMQLNFKGEHITRTSGLIAGWLSGPRELLTMIPLHAAAVAILFWVGISKKFDVLLRLIAWAAVAGHAVAFFYASSPRYYLVFWLLTLLVFAVWLQQEGLPLLRQRFPTNVGNPRYRLAMNTIGRAFTWFEKMVNVK